eukprot:EC689161.1.p1 GENE.EC689161.1~~EC689161.1.p1  ORF type:complete len:103 (-),score=36.14 EC689161.1:215-499(-)
MFQILYLISREALPDQSTRIRHGLVSESNLAVLIEACMKYCDDVMCALNVAKWIAEEGPSTEDRIEAVAPPMSTTDYSVENFLEELREEMAEDS